MGERSSNSKPKSSRFSSTSCSSQGDGRRKRLLGDGIDEGKDSLGLIKSLGELDKLPDIFCIKERFFQIGQLRLLFRLSGSIFQGFDVLPT